MLLGTALVVVVLLMYSATLGPRNISSDLDPATALAQSRRSTLEARWAQRRAHADTELRLAREQRAASPPEPANASQAQVGVATEAAASEAVPSLPVAAATVAEPVAAAAGGTGCNVPPRPYHTILTSSSGGYQSWQCRIMYHHWKLQKAQDPCGEMGGFTRLLTTHDERPDGLVKEIPTVVVKEARSNGYVVVNRPYSMVQFVHSPKFAERVTEEYVYIAETDHIMLRPLPNLATPTVPVAFNFGYMVAWGQASIVDKFVPGLGGKTDPVGPSPVLIHVAQLKRVVTPWHDFTLKIMADSEAVQHLGWVREMWGYCIATGSLGIKHRVLDALQYEGGSIGNRERRLAWPVPAVPVTPERPMPYYIFHYTYGIEYTKEGLPVELQVGEWSLDKRHYMGQGPPLSLEAPPQCAHDRAFVLRALWNNASAALAAQKEGMGWSGTGGNTGRFNRWELRDHPLRSSAAAARLLGTGPWSLSGRGRGQPFRIDRVYLMAGGWLISRKGHGRWGLRKAAAGGWEEGVVVVQVCGERELALRPTFGDAAWTLENADGDKGAVRGKLDASAEAIAAWNAPLVTPPDPLSLRIEGSGAYRGVAWKGELFLLRAGVLHADGGPGLPYGVGSRAQHLSRWVALDGTRVALGAATDADAALRSYAAGLQVAFLDCYVMRFIRPPDSPGAPLPPLPPRYVDKAEAESVEWLIKPKALQCQDACGGLTMRQLTAADRAASPLARAVEGCCGWSWHGHAGLDFGDGGTLRTPWGPGVWGAPPEAQGREAPVLLAEFAGHQHLLRAKVGRDGVVTGMGSTRCSDNDKAAITLTRGQPKLDG